MKRLAAAVALSGLIVVGGSGCGQAPAGPADPAGVMDPDEALYVFALRNPELVISRIDGIIAESGIPGVGEETLSNMIRSISPHGDLGETALAYGLKADGTVLVFMTGMAPNTFGGAVSLSDPDLFWQALEGFGLALEEREGIEGVDVVSVSSPMGPIYMAAHREVALFAGTTGIMRGMIERLADAEAASELPEGDALLYSSMDLSSLGPMVSAQMAQYRQMTLASLEYDSIGMNQRFVEGMFDVIDLFLTETDRIEYSVVFGTERIECSSWIEFEAGSELAGFFLPAQGEDLTTLLPAGETVVGRVTLDPLMTERMMMIFADLFDIDMSPDILEAVMMMTGNTGIAMFEGGEGGFPLEVVAVYEVGSDMTMEDLKLLMAGYIDMAVDMLDAMPWVSFEEPSEVEFGGRTYVHYTTAMDMSEYMGSTGMDTLVPAGGGPPLDYSSLAMEFPVWMTLDEERSLLWLEMAGEPARIDAVIDAGPAEGSAASDIPVMGMARASEEIAMALNLPAYARSLLMFMPQAALPSSITGDVAEAWVFYGLDFGEDGMGGRLIISNEDLSRAISVFAGWYSAISGAI